MLGCDSIRHAGSSHSHRPRGIFKIDRIYTSGDGGVTASGVPNADATTSKVYVQFTVSEPLFLSPFLVGADELGDHPGIYGINNMNLTINLSGSANRAWRAARFPIDVSGAAPGGSAGTKPKFFGKTVAVNSADSECEC